MWELIWRLIRWLFPKDPSPLQSFTLEVHDMSDVRLYWTLPQPTQRQRPISHVRIEARVSADQPWTAIADVPAPTSELVIQDVAPGDWFYRGIVVDEGERASAPLNATVAVDFDDPSPLGAFSAEVI